MTIGVTINVTRPGSAGLVKCTVPDEQHNFLLRKEHWRVRFLSRAKDVNHRAEPHRVSLQNKNDIQSITLHIPRAPKTDMFPPVTHSRNQKTLAMNIICSKTITAYDFGQCHVQEALRLQQLEFLHEQRLCLRKPRGNFTRARDRPAKGPPVRVGEKRKRKMRDCHSQNRS